MNRALVVLSGGQDSTTCLYWALSKFQEVRAVTFDYGQRHALELEAAAAIAKRAGVAHEVVHIGPLLLGNSALVNAGVAVETFDSLDAMTHHASFKDNKLDSSFVPMRNSLFLVLAANRAAVYDCDAIVVGVTAADFAEYGEFSWSWLGGFVDAEGRFTKVDDEPYRLRLYEKDPEIMYRLGSWLRKRTQGQLAYEFSIDKRGVCELTLGETSFRLIADRLTPHLHSSKIRDQAFHCNVPLSSQAPLDDGYVTGFWEGTGSCFGDDYVEGGARCFAFTFFHKNADLLGRLRDFTGGTVGRDAEGDGWRLAVLDEPLSAKLLTRMRNHLCVLGSFEKIDRCRHGIGLESGGFNPPYPDCTPDFIWLSQQMLDSSLKSPQQKRIKIEAPVLYYTKASSVMLAQTLPGCMEALAYSHTCYSGTYPPCGRCHACLLRAKGFSEAGVADPLQTRALAEQRTP